MPKILAPNKSIYDSTPANLVWVGGHFAAWNNNLPPNSKLKFEYKKGQQVLQEKDDTGYYTYRAGEDWLQFDFTLGFEHLVRTGLNTNNGEWIYNAGLKWKKFNYQKALDALSQISPEMVKFAHKNWPKGTLETIEISKEIKASSEKMPKKPFGLKEGTIHSVACPECGHRMWEMETKKGTISGCTNPNCPEYHKLSDATKEVRSAKLAFYGRKDR
jgi:hypothetical protein